MPRRLIAPVPSGDEGLQPRHRLQEGGDQARILPAGAALDARGDVHRLDAATSLRDLSPLKSVGLHKLSGKRKGQWAMTVNGP